MFAFAGGLLIVVSLFMAFRLFRNANRPKTTATIQKTEMRNVKQDKHQNGPQHKHAHVTYYVGNRQYDEIVPLKNKQLKEGDQITLSYKPGAPYNAEQFHPVPEIIAICILFSVGAILLGIMWWLADYYNWW